jgi:hypothetical protein
MLDFARRAIQAHEVHPMPTRKPLSAPWIAAVVLAVLLLGYVGAYYAIVYSLAVPQVDDVTGAITHTNFVPYYSGFGFDAQERLGEIFNWIHALDRRIRPHVWEPTP